MITHYPYDQLGKANYGWLKSSHHFSFANYNNPERMGFGSLRVINDDWVEPLRGFAAHPHKNMEIISFIRSGAITHQDSVGNEGITESGEVQVMSAGSGIVHSEYNRTKEPLTFYQIWIEPNKLNVKPRWQSKLFPKALSESALPLLVSGFEEDEGHALFIQQEARIYGGKLAAGAEISVPILHQAYVLCSSGDFSINDGSKNVTMTTGDGAEVTELKSLVIKARTESELIVIDAP